MEGRNSILVIEDSEADARMLSGVLGQAGVTNPLHFVFSGQEAEACLRQKAGQQSTAPSVIFLCLKISDVDGFALLHDLRLLPHLARSLIVVISPTGDSPSIRRAYSLGANSFLTKPLRLVDVENLIHGFPLHWTVSRPEG